MVSLVSLVVDGDESVPAESVPSVAESVPPLWLSLVDEPSSPQPKPSTTATVDEIQALRTLMWPEVSPRGSCNAKPERHVDR